MSKHPGGRPRALTADEAALVLQKFLGGATQAELAQEFGVSLYVVRQITQNQRQRRQQYTSDYIEKLQAAYAQAVNEYIENKQDAALRSRYRKLEHQVAIAAMMAAGYKYDAADGFSKRTGQ